MRKLLVILALAIVPFVLSNGSKVYAEPINVGTVMESLPPLNQGIAFSLIDNKLNYLSTATVATWKDMVSLEVGYAGDAEETGHKIVGVLSLDLLQLKDINVPLLKYVKFQPGLFIGFGNINAHRIMESEFDWGISATVLEFSF